MFRHFTSQYLGHTEGALEQEVLLKRSCTICHVIFEYGNVIVLYRCQHAMHEACCQEHFIKCEKTGRLALCMQCCCVLFAPIVRKELVKNEHKRAGLVRDALSKSPSVYSLETNTDDTACVSHTHATVYAFEVDTECTLNRQIASCISGGKYVGADIDEPVNIPTNRLRRQSSIRKRVSNAVKMVRSDSKRSFRDLFVLDTEVRHSTPRRRSSVISYSAEKVKSWSARLSEFIRSYSTKAHMKDQ